jgi:hypothetical protein
MTNPVYQSFSDARMRHDPEALEQFDVIFICMPRLFLLFTLLLDFGSPESNRRKVYFSCSDRGGMNFAVEFKGNREREATLYDWNGRTFSLRKLKDSESIEYVDKLKQVRFYPHPRPGNPTLQICDLVYDCRKLTPPTNKRK